TIDSAITVGTLSFNTFQHYDLASSGGTLTLSAGAGEEGIVIANGPGASTLYNFTVPLVFASAVRIQNVPNGPLGINSAISGSGDLIMVGSGTTYLELANPAWTGAATVQSGTLTVFDAGAL